MKQVRIALIGFGYWGTKIYKTLKKNKTALLTAVCDSNPVKTQALLATTNIRIVNDVRNILDCNIDGVIIATPPKTHYRIATMFLRLGKHVLIEKPLTLNTTEAKKLNSLVQYKKVIFQVNHTYIFSDEIQYIKKAIQYKKLGQIIYVESIRYSPGKYYKDCNVIWDLGSHDISILYYLWGKPKKIKTYGYHFLNKKNCDMADIELLFNPNITAKVRLSWLYPIKIRKITIIGTAGTIIYDDTKTNKITQFSGLIDKNKSLAEINNDLLNISHNRKKLKISNNLPLDNSLNNFIRAIELGQQSISDVKMGLEVVKILEKTNKSLLLGGRIITYD